MYSIYTKILDQDTGWVYTPVSYKLYYSIENCYHSTIQDTNRNQPIYEYIFITIMILAISWWRIMKNNINVFQISSCSQSYIRNQYKIISFHSTKITTLFHYIPVQCRLIIFFCLYTLTCMIFSICLMYNLLK